MVKTFTLTCLGLLFMVASIALGADKKGVRFTASKIEHSKDRERDKLFGKWMTVKEFASEVDARSAKRELLLYYEYHGGKDQWRGIFSAAARYDSWYYYAAFGQNDAEQWLGTYLDRGYLPTFIVRDGNYYTFIVMKGDGLNSAQKALAELGIGEPKIK